MTGDRAAGQDLGVAVGVTLACTACQHAYQPTATDFDSGNTGCRRCGGWTWIAQLGRAPCSEVLSSDRPGARQQRVDSSRPDPVAIRQERPPGGLSRHQSELERERAHVTDPSLCDRRL